jgi:hypothetical protein
LPKIIAVNSREEKKNLFAKRRVAGVDQRESPSDLAELLGGPGSLDPSHAACTDYSNSQSTALV